MQLRWAKGLPAPKVGETAYYSSVDIAEKTWSLEGVLLNLCLCVEKDNSNWVQGTKPQSLPPARPHIINALQPSRTAPTMWHSVVKYLSLQENFSFQLACYPTVKNTYVTYMWEEIIFHMSFTLQHLLILRVHVVSVLS